MKNKFLWAGAITLLLAAFISCSEKENELTSLSLIVDKAELSATSTESFNFTVTGNDGQDYTSTAEFYVDGNKINGYSYSPAGNSGNHTVYAKVGDIKSNEIAINVTAASASLLLSVDKESLFETSTELFNFTVTGNDGADYTSEAEFYVDNVKIAGFSYPANGNVGSHDVYAKANGIKSNVLSINVVKDSDFESIILSCDISEPCPMVERVTFSAIGKLLESGMTIDVSNLVTLYVNDASIGASSSYIFPAVGNYTVYAKIGTYSSNTLTINAKMPASFVHKVLIEDITGTWCGYCTRVLYGIEKVHELTDKVVVAAIHYDDQWNLNTVNPLMSAFQVTGLPYALLNRTAKWSSEATNTSQPINMLQESAKQGIAISSTLGASSGTIGVTILFAEAVNNAKCVVYVLEDNLVANQQNAYTGSGGYFGGANPIVNFNHKDVVRASVTHILGNNSTIPAANSVAQGIYQKTFTANNYTSSNVDNLKVMVILLNSAGKVINVQVAPANQTVFERL